MTTSSRGVFAGTDRFPGRWILVASFTLLMFSSGVGFYGLAVYLQAFSRELGWSVSSISLATTFFFLVGGVSGTTIELAGLDAIDGSPVVDIKPWMSEFGPRGAVTQPKWSTELMAHYW